MNTPSRIVLRPPTSEPQSLHRCEVELSGVRWQMILDRNLPTQRYIHDHITAGRCYEGESTLALIAELKAGETFFDVGANCGWFSALGLALGARVFAWEPDAVNAAALRQNASTATVFEEALSDVNWEVRWFDNLDNDGGHSLWPCGLHPHNTATAKAGNPSRFIKAKRLETFVELTGIPAVLKIDTEGAECNVLRGAEAILANPTLRMVICERHPMGLQLLGHSPAEIEAIMRRHGFTWEQPESDVVSNWIFRR